MPFVRTFAERLGHRLVTKSNKNAMSGAGIHDAQTKLKEYYEIFSSSHLNRLLS